MEHTCVTADGVRIEVGLRVIDYDAEIGTVAEAPSSPYEPCDGKGWSRSGVQGCWWGVKRDKDGTTRTFDGSRMTTSGAK